MYAGVSCDPAGVDKQGWGSSHEIFEVIIRAARPAVIVEVGTWKGASAIHMGQICKSLSLHTEIICVDTWLGSPEHFLHPEFHESLRIKNGMPNLYQTFLTNIVCEGLCDTITPLATTSDNAATILLEQGLSADVIYLDGAHAYDSVSRDLANYSRLVRPGGYIIGDDYMWESVKRAVDDFFTARDWTLNVVRNKYWTQVP